MRKHTWLLMLAGFAVLLTACGGEAEPMPIPDVSMEPSGMATAASPTLTPTAALRPTAIDAEPAIPPAAGMLVRLAALDLVQIRDVAAEAIKLVLVEPVQWSDASLGCPAPGTDYAQVITPGYEILLQAEGVLYTYHSDEEARVVLCQDGDPAAMPPIPLAPGEKILDGIPWMPVGPLPTGSAGEGEIADPAPIK